MRVNNWLFGSLILSMGLWIASCDAFNPFDNDDDGNNAILMSFLVDSVGLDACVLDTLPNSSLPVNAQAYLDSAFAQDSVTLVQRFQLGSGEVYGATLSDECPLLFDAGGNLIELTEADEDDVRTQEVEDSLAANFPLLLIKDIELKYEINGAEIFEVELRLLGDFYLVVYNGEFCVLPEFDYDDDCDDDEDDDEEDDDDEEEEELIAYLVDSVGLSSCIVDTLPTTSLPTNALTYVDSVFGQGALTQVLQLELGAGVVYSAEVDEDCVLLFDAAGNLLEVEDADDNSAREMAVKDSLETSFPLLDIDEIELEYEVNGAEIFEVELDDDGEFYLVAFNGAFCVLPEYAFSDDDCDD